VFLFLEIVMTTKVAIINVTGYAGAELARILHAHPETEISCVTGRGEAGKPLGEVFPHLAQLGLTVEPEINGSVDFAFSALPHAASAETCAPLAKSGIPVVDISADFRLKDPAEYSEWYGGAHPAPELLDHAVYGLPEFYRDQIKQAKLVANPGCYPESVLLGLAPAVKAGILAPDVIADSKSGVSGAGRALKQNLHLGEAGESISAYALDGHRHLPEIVQELANIWPAAESPAGAKPTVSFTPHLVPMTRGILSTCYATLAPGTNTDTAGVRGIYADFYKDEPFVQLADSPPSTKQTRGTNHCLVYPVVDQRANRLVVVSVLDNLVKGAAGQAVQNMNLMLGFEETTALAGLAVYP
jgi:N-acetyl-gamma-glutamyl-phosphate reductase